MSKILYSDAVCHNCGREIAAGGTVCEIDAPGGAVICEECANEIYEPEPKGEEE